MPDFENPRIPFPAWSDDPYYKNVASVYDSTQTYQAGDVVLSPNGELVKALTETTGEYDPNDWEATTIMGAAAGGGLPPVTSDDNGDVLTVVEGAWAKAAPSGGGVVTIPVTRQYSSGVYYLVNADYTYQQIFDLVQAGTEVVIKEPNGYLGRVSRCFKNAQNNIVVAFVGLYPYGGGIAGFAATGNSSTSSTLKVEFTSDLSVADGPSAVLTEDNGNLIAASMTSDPSSSQRYYTTESVFMGEAKHWYSTVSYYVAPMSGTINIVIKDDMTGDLYHLTSFTQPYTFTPYTP